MKKPVCCDQETTFTPRGYICLECGAKFVPLRVGGYIRVWS